MSKKQYEVKVECIVVKLVTCEDCTLEQATLDPFAYSVDELEIDQKDWKTLSAKEVDA